MKNAALIVLGLVLLGSCVGRVSVAEFKGIYPGMSCTDLEAYLEKQDIPFKKDGAHYRFDLKERAWKNSVVTCDNVVSKMEFDSKKGSTVQETRAYIDAQTLLLNAFRDSMITYEEGNKTINLNNGLKLHQFADSGSGVITQFRIGVDNVAGAKEAWERAAILLSMVGGEKSSR